MCGFESAVDVRLALRRMRAGLVSCLPHPLDERRIERQDERRANAFGE